MINSIEGNFDHPEVNDLLKKHFIELRAASPKGSAHVLDITGLKVSSIKFWSFWYKKKLFGCGALKFLNKYHGELKSIRIHNNFRYNRNGIKLIELLLIEARKLEIKRISIETGAGKFFEPARKLFKKCNFKPCKPFAHYKEDENSIYLTKPINNNFDKKLS